MKFGKQSLTFCSSKQNLVQFFWGNGNLNFFMENVVIVFTTVLDVVVVGGGGGGDGCGDGG